MDMLGGQWVAAASVVALAFVAAPASAAERKDASLKPTFIVRQQIEGEVTKVDPARGVVVVNTGIGKVKLEVPGTDIGSLSKGDYVWLEMGIAPALPAAPPAAGGPAPGTGRKVIRQRLDAEVTRVDSRTGFLRLKTTAGTLKMLLPSHLLEQFKRGDRVPAELALSPQPAMQASPRTDDSSARRAGLATLLLELFRGRGER